MPGEVIRGRDIGTGQRRQRIDQRLAGLCRSEVTAGWVSVLLAMKAAVDYGVDLRNHDETRTWSSGFADN